MEKAEEEGRSFHLERDRHPNIRSAKRLGNRVENTREKRKNEEKKTTQEFVIFT